MKTQIESQLRDKHNQDIQKLKEEFEQERLHFEKEKEDQEKVLRDMFHAEMDAIKSRVDNDLAKQKALLLKVNMNYRPVVPGGAGGAMAPPDFGRSVNPISTKGGTLCPPNNTGNTGFSDLPTALNYEDILILNKNCQIPQSNQTRYRTRAIITRGLYIFFTPFFSAVYNQERLILQTIMN